MFIDYIFSLSRLVLQTLVYQDLEVKQKAYLIIIQ